MSGHPQRIAWLVFGVAAIVSLAFGLTQTPPDAARSLAADFAELQNDMDAQIGIVLAPVGATGKPVELGRWTSGPAWSTIKVPMIMAALRETDRITHAMTAAITESDNQAAEAIWASLGDPKTAARKVEAILRAADDNTVVQSVRIRPEFTAFGQTDWSLAAQSRFLSAAACDSRNEPVLALMGQVIPEQRWGIGTIPGTRFKGGWGPSLTDHWLVRQFGLLNTPGGVSVVAIAAEPASGSYYDGMADLTKIAEWLQARIGSLPAGQCAH
jgi:hypothetical protein